MRVFPKYKIPIPEPEKKQNNMHLQLDDAITCLMEHFKVFHHQTLMENRADFYEACNVCKLRLECQGDWVEKISTLKTDVEVFPKIMQTMYFKGEGTKEDPYTLMVQFWDTEGRLLAENKKSNIDKQKTEWIRKEGDK